MAEEIILKTAIPFNACILKSGQKLYPGIATGCFAGDMFRSKGGDEYITEVSGRSFLWYDFEDQREYKSDKSEIRRPTIEEWNTLFTEEMRQTCIKSFENSQTFKEKTPAQQMIKRSL